MADMTPENLHTLDAGPLAVAYYDFGPEDGRPVMLVHGWPDDALTWGRVLPTLHDGGFRTIVPYLRGFGETRFRDDAAMRSGTLAALGQDILDLADALGLKKFDVVGHDWGARGAYIAAVLAPDRIGHCVALSVGWGTNDPDQALSLRQAQNYWYHWYMALDRGAGLVENDRISFTRYLWDTWAPGWNVSDDEFALTAKSFDNADWAEIVLHSYRVRWGLAPLDPAYIAAEERVAADPTIHVPTLVIHGGGDPCNGPETSEGKEAFFKAAYKREVLDGIGHFPQREAASETAKLIAGFLQT